MNTEDDMRLLAVLPGMWARGAEICTLNLLAGLKMMGHTNLYFHAALRQAIPANMEAHLQPRFEQVANVSWGIHGDRDGLNVNLAKAVQDAKPDILLYAFDKSIPKYAPEAKSVLVVHGIAKNDFGGYHPDHTDAVVCVSQYATDMAPGYGIPEEKLYHIPNGVPLVKGCDRREEWDIPDDAWVWCFVGGLTRLKRPQLLIAAMARRKHMDDEYAVFAGHPDGGMLLEGYAQALGVSDRCIFLGHTDDVGDVYHSSNCLVVTSERESMPLIILEAMSASLPVVATSVGGIPEILRNDFSCMFTDESGENGLDKALNDMRTKAKDDPIFAYAYSRWKGHYTLPHMVSEYCQLFGELLEKP
jgi:glycosyltransferase involved in cell wall biosynthesis